MQPIHRTPFGQPTECTDPERTHGRQLIVGDCVAAWLAAAPGRLRRLMVETFAYLPARSEMPDTAGRLPGAARRRRAPFLHADWMHLVMNMAFFRLRFRHRRRMGASNVALYLICAAAAFPGLSIRDSGALGVDVGHVSPHNHISAAPPQRLQGASRRSSPCGGLVAVERRIWHLSMGCRMQGGIAGEAFGGLLAGFCRSAFDGRGQLRPSPALWLTNIAMNRIDRRTRPDRPWTPWNRSHAVLGAGRCCASPRRTARSWR
jgi:hypothetical protein